MLAKSLKNYLDNRRIKYVTITHSKAYTAHEVAESAHIPEQMLAKTVMVVLDGVMAMAVVPSDHQVQLDEIRDLTHSNRVRLAKETEFRRFFPDCASGAMPPFGNLYDMSTYVSPELSVEGEIAFNAGSHTEVIRMSWADYESLVKPQVARFTA